MALRPVQSNGARWDRSMVQVYAIEHERSENEPGKMPRQCK